MNIEPNKSKLNQYSSHREEIAEQADHVYQEAKKLGSQIYDEGRSQFDHLHGNIKEHSDKVVQKVHESPLSALTVAAGIGFLLGRLFLRK